MSTTTVYRSDYGIEIRDISEVCDFSVGYAVQEAGRLLRPGVVLYSIYIDSKIGTVISCSVGNYRFNTLTPGNDDIAARGIATVLELAGFGEFDRSLATVIAGNDEGFHYFVKER